MGWEDDSVSVLVWQPYCGKRWETVWGKNRGFATACCGLFWQWSESQIEQRHSASNLAMASIVENRQAAFLVALKSAIPSRAISSSWLGRAGPEEVDLFRFLILFIYPGKFDQPIPWQRSKVGRHIQHAPACVPVDVEQEVFSLLLINLWAHTSGQVYSELVLSLS